MWPKGNNIDDAIVIGVEEGGLYKLNGKLDQALVHSTINASELWHRRFVHLHYRALPIVSKAVIGLPELQVNHVLFFINVCEHKVSCNKLILFTLLLEF